MVKHCVAIVIILICVGIGWISRDKPVVPAQLMSPKQATTQALPVKKAPLAVTPMPPKQPLDSRVAPVTPNIYISNAVTAETLALFSNFDQMSEEERVTLLIRLAENGVDTTALVLQLIEDGKFMVNVPVLREPGVETPLIIAMGLDSQMTPDEMQKFIDLGSYQTIDGSFLQLIQMQNPETAAMLMDHLGYGPEHTSLIVYGAAISANRALFDSMTEKFPDMLMNSGLKQYIESTLQDIKEVKLSAANMDKRFKQNPSSGKQSLKAKKAALFKKQILRRQMLLEMQTLSFEERRELHAQIAAFESVLAGDG
ncbi:hypothetical protein HHX48_09815 [Salinimonas sp. HHU 13199]|uniref:DUF4375 domain-containing protein n=1 Tax=Salinimonas profundi TaxID=2729140 RepID=A0ABR8LL45_9ALTE|nr:hypothetical protein [Salinimonas profundi]MBD3586033.1 hypothetical protein [Salinimonas profundi]